MTFTSKDWKDFPDTTTPITAAALEDVETRLSDYTDDELATHSADTTSVHGIANTALLVTATEVDAIEVVTQAEYDALTPATTTLYVIVG